MVLAGNDSPNPMRLVAVILGNGIGYLVVGVLDGDHKSFARTAVIAWFDPARLYRVHRMSGCVNKRASQHLDVLWRDTFTIRAGVETSHYLLVLIPGNDSVVMENRLTLGFGLRVIVVHAAARDSRVAQ